MSTIAKIMFHLRVNLMYAIIGTVTLMGASITDQPKFWLGVGGMWIGVFLLEIIAGVINHDKDYEEGNI